MSLSPPTANHRQMNRHGCYRQTASSYIDSWRSGGGGGGAFTATPKNIEQTYIFYTHP